MNYIERNLKQIFNNTLNITMSIYVIIAVLIYYYKPPIMFDKDGKMKPFGIGNGHTLCTYQNVLLFLAITLFFIITYINKKINKRKYIFNFE